MEAIGSESEMLNHAYSSWFLPLNSALRGLPVLMRPGTTVVTTMPSFITSLRSPREKPTNANLLAEYGSRCGTAIFPPIEVMFTILPLRLRRIPGNTDSDVYTPDQKFESIAL